jgi:hypothetical protein
VKTPLKSVQMQFIVAMFSQACMLLIMVFSSLILLIEKLKALVLAHHGLFGKILEMLRIP